MSFSHTSPASTAGKPSISFRRAGTIVLCAFFISGAAGLIHEVAWTRLLRLVMGNTAFSITTVLCAFMGGLALGSFLGGRFIDRRNDPLRVFAFLEGTIALYCFLLPWLIQGAEPLYRLIYQNTHTSFYLFSLIRFVFSGSAAADPRNVHGGDPAGPFPVFRPFPGPGRPSGGGPLFRQYLRRRPGRGRRRVPPHPEPGCDPDDLDGLPVQCPGRGNGLLALPPHGRRRAGSCSPSGRAHEEKSETCRGGKEEKGETGGGRRPPGDSGTGCLRTQSNGVPARRVWRVGLCRPGLRDRLDPRPLSA